MVTLGTAVVTPVVTPSTRMDAHGYASYAIHARQVWAQAWACGRACVRMRKALAVPSVTMSIYAVCGVTIGGCSGVPSVTIILENQKGKKWTKLIARSSSKSRTVSAPSARHRNRLNPVRRESANVVANGGRGWWAAYARPAATSTTCRDAVRAMRRRFLPAGFFQTVLHGALHRPAQNAGAAARLAGAHSITQGIGVHGVSRGEFAGALA